jgi:hypothetical protein
MFGGANVDRTVCAVEALASKCVETSDRLERPLALSPPAGTSNPSARPPPAASWIASGHVDYPFTTPLAQKYPLTMGCEGQTMQSCVVVVQASTLQSPWIGGRCGSGDTTPIHPRSNGTKVTRSIARVQQFMPVPAAFPKASVWWVVRVGAVARPALPAPVFQTPHPVFRT